MADKTKKMEELVKGASLPEDGRFGQTSLTNFVNQLKYGQLCLLLDILGADDKIVKGFHKVLENATKDYTYR